MRKHVSVGDVYGRLTVVEITNSMYVVTKCSCGNIKQWTRRYDLSSGKVKSCGCLMMENSHTFARTHGASKTKEYSIWCDMKRRCYNTKRSDYKYYGGRGIVVCERWHQFENFLSDMGLCPDGMTLDRKEVNGNYEPSNCKWSTREEQCHNKRPLDLITITFNNETKALKEWAAVKGIKEDTLRNRLSNGWTIERALTRPVSKNTQLK